MSYELSPFPPALFEARNILRKAAKPQLAQAIRYHATDLSSEAVYQGMRCHAINVIHDGSCVRQRV